MSSPKAIPPEMTLAGSGEASAEHHQRAQRNEPRADQANQGPDLKNPAPRNRDSLAKLLIVSLQITALFKICLFFKRSNWFHGRITWEKLLSITILKVKAD